MKSFGFGALAVDVSAIRTEMTLTWRGTSDARDPSALLTPPLNAIAAGITANHSLVLDFRQLEYMNSSSVRPILAFLQQVSGTAKSVRVVYASQKSWQRLSFMAMRAVLATAKNVSFDS